MYDLVKRKIGENIHNTQTIDELFHFNNLPKKRNKIEQCNIFLYTLNQQYKVVKQRNVDRIMMQ